MEYQLHLNHYTGRQLWELEPVYDYPMLEEPITSEIQSGDQNLQVPTATSIRKIIRSITLLSF